MIRSEPLSCSDVVELVTEYLEGSMPPERRLGFEEHIAICHLRNYFDQFRHTVELGKKIEEDELPADVRDARSASSADWRRTSGDRLQVPRTGASAASASFAADAGGDGRVRGCGRSDLENCRTGSTPAGSPIASGSTTSSGRSSSTGREELPSLVVATQRR